MTNEPRKFRYANKTEIMAATPEVSISPAGLLAAIGFSAYFESAEQTITSAGSLTIAHSLGRTPIFLQVVLKNTTAEGGYSVGDVTFTGAINSNDINSATGVMVVPDATNLNIRFASGANVFSMIRKDNGNLFNLTNANWTIIFRVLA